MSWISRKELAQAADVSTKTIQRNEHRLGLDEHKVAINKRLILYDRDGALEALEDNDGEQVDTQE
jgi:hypothetical protein